MDKQRKPKYDYDEQAEQVIFQQINDSYHSGYIDLHEEQVTNETK